MSAPRRYRGLHLVSADGMLKVTRHVDRLAQTQAIVDQVEREVAQRAGDAKGDELRLLSPVDLTASLPLRAARRLVPSLFPVGSEG